MEEIFDTYKRKTKLYYILQTTSFLTITFIIAVKVTGMQIPNTLIITLFIIGLAIIVTNMVLTSTNLVKMYNKDGSITIATDKILINSLKIHLKDIEKIEISANDYKGARSSDGSGNRIEIFDHLNKGTLFRFVICSKDQKNKLNGILKELESKGITIISA